MALTSASKAFKFFPIIAILNMTFALSYSDALSVYIIAKCSSTTNPFREYTLAFIADNVDDTQRITCRRMITNDYPRTYRTAFVLIHT